MQTDTNIPIVELPEIMRSTTHNIPLERQTMAALYRKMEVGDAIEIKPKSRNGIYTAASQAVPDFKFSTRKIDGKIYLLRIA